VERKITKIPAPAYKGDETERHASAADQEAANRAAAYLHDGFFWEDTAEGRDFWRGVYDRLAAIADGEPLR